MINVEDSAMGKKRKQCYSGIGGQAVMEGIMMRNKNRYSVAVRKADKTIEIMTGDCKQTTSIWSKIPFIRGVYNFVDSLSVGMKAMSYSAEFFAEGDEQETAFDRLLRKIFGEKAEKVIVGMSVFFAIVLAVGIFIVLPWFLSALLERYISNVSLIAIIEGILRITIFILYVLLISLMKDIRRVFMYHGAEHKCINCIESGKSLTVKNIMKSSRMHKRCGTSFLLIVMVISIILFFFIRVDVVWLRLILRIALVPVIAGIAYEILRLAGKFDNWFIDLISAPGVALQLLTTREPDEDMVEVAIKSIEAVYDWKAYLKENFEYDSSEEGWLDDDEDEEEEDVIPPERMHVNTSILPQVEEPDKEACDDSEETVAEDAKEDETAQENALKEAVEERPEEADDADDEIAEEESDEAVVTADDVEDIATAEEEAAVVAEVEEEESVAETDDDDDDDEPTSVEELNRLLDGFTGTIDLGDYK